MKILTVMLAAALLASCAANPVTGKTSLSPAAQAAADRLAAAAVAGAEAAITAKLNDALKVNPQK